VFLSYASQDAEAAGRICAALRGAGIEVWFDQSDLRGGDAWDRKIRQEIRDCSLFVPVLSHNAQSRPEGYFRLEWHLADQRTHLMSKSRSFLVPVCIDDLQGNEADVPDSFQSVQWTRLPSGSTGREFVARIAHLLNPDDTLSTRAGRFAGGAAPVAMSSAAGGAAETDIPDKSIAVLPFVNMSADKEQDYFSDGLAEELINLLARIPDLRVPARTSSFSFRGQQVTAREIGRALKVAHVLEGSVRKAGQRVRVTAQLVRTDNGYHHWSETYDRDLSDIFQVQDDIACAVVEKLKLTLLAPVSVASAKPVNAEAHNLYLQAQYFRARESEADLAKAVDFYRRALAIDREYATAWASLSGTYIRQVANGYIPVDDGFRLVREAAERAIGCDATLGDAYAALSVAQAGGDHDWLGAAATLARGEALDPGNPQVMLIGAIQCVAFGALEESRARFRAILDRDPLNLLVRRYFARMLLHANLLDEAEAEIRKVLELSPAYPAASYELGRILLAKGNVAAAVAAFEAETNLNWRSFGLPLGYYAQGRAEDVRNALATMQTTGSEFQYAEALAYIGDADGAFKWLDAARVNRDPGLIWLRSNPLLSGITSDPRYQAFTRQINLPD
jgi:TolB-like protein